jgi:alpha-amylase
VHAYFNPYESPYDACIIYMNALKDVEIRLEKLESSATTTPTSTGKKSKKRVQ